MSKTIRILGIGDSLRRQSYNHDVLRAATQLAPEGASIDIFEIDGISIFNQGRRAAPAKVVGRRVEERDRLGLTHSH